jgi:YbbR domain-containing protein
MKILLRNWHLKLSAVLLAMVLYTGLVFSGSFSDAELQVPIEPVNASRDAFVLTGDLGFVQVRYRTTNDVVSTVPVDAFRATVDLSEYDLDLAPEPQQLDVDVTTDVEGIQVLSWEPRTIRIEMDRIEVRTVPVEVDTGEVPEGLEIGDPQLSDTEAQLRGPASVIEQVDRVVAFISIAASGIDFNEPVSLVAVDIRNQPIQSGPVEIDPETVSVQVDVEELETSKTVPVDPQISGTPAAGFALDAISVEPTTVVLIGTSDALDGVTLVQTEPLSIDDASSDQAFEAALLLPPGTRVEGGSADEEPSITVTATIVPSVSSRTFVLGLVCQGAGANACLVGLEQVTVTVSGPGAALSGLTAAQLTPFVDASGLDPGTYDLPLAVAGLPDGVELLAISPGTVSVTIEAPVTPTPAPTPAPEP